MLWRSSQFKNKCNFIQLWKEGQKKKIGLSGIPTLTSLTALVFFSFESTEIILPVKMFSNGGYKTIVLFLLSMMYIWISYIWMAKWRNKCCEDHHSLRINVTLYSCEKKARKKNWACWDSNSDIFICVDLLFIWKYWNYLTSKNVFKL